MPRRCGAFCMILMHVEPVALPERVETGGRRASCCAWRTIYVVRENHCRSPLADCSALADLAPLHNPPSLATLAAAEAELPGVPHVAVFDTAFHATLPPEAWNYPVPKQWTREWGIRRYRVSRAEPCVLQPAGRRNAGSAAE